jgi:hypothetical protein
MERLITAFSIVAVVFALTHVFFAVGGSKHNQPAPVVVNVERAPDAKALLKQLETLDARLHEAQASIDKVLAKLSTVHDASEVEATRVRLDVLYRLESGLTADIARTREALAHTSAR